MKHHVSTFCCFIFLFLFLAPDADLKSLPVVRHPVLLIPGLSASQIEARLDKNSAPHFFCSRHTDWYRIWFAPTEFVPKVLDCFIENFRLIFNEKTGRTENPPGVETRVPGFGQTERIEYLGSVKFGPANYFHNLVESLVSLGYSRGSSIRGAPYDFRRSLYENEEYLVNVEKLIEEMYHSNGDSKVILVCHSMGCLYSYYLLQHRPQTWKDQYIQSWITIAAPFGGSVKSLAALTSGENFHTELFHESGLLELERTWSSLSLLLPSAHVFGERTILSVGNTNYTSKDYDKFYELINDPAGYRMWQSSSILITDFADPGVEVHCLRGKNMPTPEQVTYPDPESFPQSPATIYGSGDGTVNQISSDVCLKWAGRSGFYTKEFEGIRHLDMVKHVDVVSHVTGRVLHANLNSS